MEFCWLIGPRQKTEGSGHDHIGSLCMRDHETLDSKHMLLIKYKKAFDTIGILITLRELPRINKHQGTDDGNIARWSRVASWVELAD
jgi:hypothetical protein